MIDMKNTVRKKNAIALHMHAVLPLSCCIMKSPVDSLNNVLPLHMYLMAISQRRGQG